VSAGLVLTALLVPAGMGYAQAAGLPPVHGLYATIVPLVVYALVGPSRIMVMAPDSSLAPLIFAAVVPLAAAGGDPERAVVLAAMLAILAGLLSLLAGVAKLGFLADLLSAPVRYGYINGIALTVAVGQLPKLLGFTVASDDLLARIGETVEAIADGAVDPTAATLGLASLAVILLLRRWAPRVPGMLVAVVGATLAVIWGGLADEGLALVGDLPQGLPTPAWPDASWSEVLELFAAAVGIAFVSFADTSVLSRTYARRTRQDVDPDHELWALGAVNIGTGLFQGFPVSSSSSRTPVAEEAGARTQVTGLVGAAVVAVLVVFAPSLFRYLPQAALAAVVIAASTRLVEIPGLVRLARVRRGDLVLSLIAFAGVAVLGAIPGVGIAVGLSVLDVMRRAWRPYTAELVRVTGLKGYHDVARHPEGHRVPGLLLYRFDAPLFFANVGYFTEDLLHRVDRSVVTPRRVVVTAEPITDVDPTAAEELGHLIDALAERGVRLEFAELKGRVRDTLDRYGLVDRLGRDRFWRTVGEAVRQHVSETGVDWVDWEDREPPVP
jgi:high affinity sulfate transporter 1